MRLRSSFPSCLSLIFLLLLGLTACGDPTVTPSPATTVAPTRVASTSAVSSTSSTAATTPSAAVTSVSASKSSLPTIPGLKEIELDPTLAGAFTQQLPKLSNAIVQVFVADDSVDMVVSNADSALTGAGFQFAIPGETKPIKQGDSIGGLYAKTGAPDVLLSAVAIPTDAAELSKSGALPPGLSAAAAQKFIDQLKGKKTLLILISAPDILKTLFSSVANAQTTLTPSSTTVAVVTPTTIVTTAPATTVTTGLPTFTNVEYVTPDSAVLSAFSKQLSTLKSITVGIYSSNDPVDKVATMVDQAYTSVGFTSPLGGSTMNKQGDNYVGVYSRSNTPDTVLIVFTVPTDASELARILSIPNLDQASYQKLLGSLQDKKSAIFSLTATDLVKAVFSSSSPTPGRTGVTPVAASTTQTGSESGAVSESDIPVYPGAKRVDSASTVAAGVIALYYLSKDPAETIAAGAKDAFSSKGWTDLTQVEVNGATFVQGKKGNSKMSATILGSKARGNTNYDPIFKLATAGPDDSVIFVIITPQA